MSWPGCVAYSSFESMSNQLPQDQWSLSSDAAYYRNWPVDLVIRSYFGDQDFNATGEAPFKKQLYQSMLGQALNHKTTIESWRASNVYGTTIWVTPLPRFLLLSLAVCVSLTLSLS